MWMWGITCIMSSELLCLLSCWLVCKHEVNVNIKSGSIFFKWLLCRKFILCHDQGRSGVFFFVPLRVVSIINVRWHSSTFQGHFEIEMWRTWPFGANLYVVFSVKALPWDLISIYTHISALLVIYVPYTQISHFFRYIYLVSTLIVHLVTDCSFFSASFSCPLYPVQISRGPVSVCLYVIGIFS